MGAILDQLVSALGARVERRSRHCKNLAVLFGGETRGDQRARFLRRLDHQNAARHARYDAVAAREMSRLGLGAQGHFRQGRAAINDALIDVGIFLRVDDIRAAGQNRRRAAIDCALVGGPVDAPRHARYNQITLGADIASQPLGQAKAVG